MIVTKKILQTRQHIAEVRSQGMRIVGFVPTMGALHAAHLSLIKAARQECDWVVVSIFVNPKQFGPDEGFEQYPRSLPGDLAACETSGVDLVFHPNVDELYEEQSVTTVHVAEITEELCGRDRPGHFDGVALVVSKLFNIITPDRAYFGQKDAQQLSVIRHLVQDLNMPIEVVACPIVREPDGLAVSSRNVYLREKERQQATILYRSLRLIQDLIRAGETNSDTIVRNARRFIEQSGPCRIDYVELVDPKVMGRVERVAGPVLAAVAVQIGKCRLIDNLLITVSSPQAK